MPEGDPRRPAVGTMMEVVLADQAPDGKLYLAVRALGPVKLRRVVQQSPYLRAIVEWRPDSEEVEAAGGEAPAVCAAEAWATSFESSLDPEELKDLRPIYRHLVEVAKQFHELAPPRCPQPSCGSSTLPCPPQHGLSLPLAYTTVQVSSGVRQGRTAMGRT